MPRLRRLSGKEIIEILKQFGFEIDRVKGSHHIMTRVVGDQVQTLTVPIHRKKPLALGTLRSIYRDALEYLSEDDLKSYFYGE